MDERRRFNGTERAALYLAADGRCDLCGTDLASGWHADHVTPHSRDGDTDVVNGQALCPPCNLKKGNTVEYRDSFRPRPFQTEVIEKVLNNHSGGKRVTIALASPGSGKTITSQAVACELYRAGAIDFVIVLVPRIVLAKQCETDWRAAVTAEPRRDEDLDWTGDYKLFDPSGRIEFIEHTPNRTPLLPDTPRGRGAVSTYSSLVNSMGQLVFESFARRHQGRFLLVADEAQFCGEDSATGGGTRAGAMVKMLHHYATHTLLMTGTPYRSDDNPMILAEYGPPSEDGLRPLVCDVSSTYQDGVREGYLRKFEATLTNAKVRRRDKDTDVVTEYDLSHDGDDLREVLRRPDVWRPIVDGVVAAVKDKQNVHPEHRALISCMEQREVTAVQQYLRSQYPHLRVSVSKSEDGAEAELALKAFKTEPADVLVTVRKAFIGYDCKSISVVGVLTNYRDSGHLMQLIGRGLRAWDRTSFDSQSCRIIAPDDPKMQDFIAVLRQELAQGLRERNERDSESGEAGEPTPATTFVESAQASSVRAVNNDIDLDPTQLQLIDSLAREQGLSDDRTKLWAFAKAFGAGQAPEAEVPQQRPIPRTSAERIADYKSETTQIIRDALSDVGIYANSPGYSDAIMDATVKVNKLARCTAKTATTEEEHQRRRDAALRYRSGQGVS